MKNQKLSTIILAMSLPMTAHGIGIDSLIKIMDSDSEVFTLSNHDNYRQFVNITVSDVSLVDGKLVATPYTKENIRDWSLEARPNKMIVDTGQNKKFSIRYFGDKEASKDKIYSVSVVPTPYYNEGESPNNSVQMVIGVAPYVIKPAVNDQPLTYRIEHLGRELRMQNLGKTYFNATIKVCDSMFLKADVKECMSRSIVLAGRDLKISLPERSEDEVEVTLSTHNKTYTDKFDIRKGQVEHR